MTQYTQIGCLFDAAIGTSSPAASTCSPWRATREDAVVVQLRHGVGRSDGSGDNATDRVVAAGAAARGAAARRPVAVVLMPATGGEITRRRLRLRLHFDGDRGAGRWRRAIRDGQVRETARQRSKSKKIVIVWMAIKCGQQLLLLLLFRRRRTATAAAARRACGALDYPPSVLHKTLMPLRQAHDVRTHGT